MLFSVMKLDMLTAHQHLKSPWSLQYLVHPPTPPWSHKVNIMVMNGPLTSLLFHVNHHLIPEIKAISNSDLETSRSWVWSKEEVIDSAQYLSNSLPFHFTSIRLTIPEIFLISKSDLEKSMVKVMSEVKRQGNIVYPVSNWCSSFSFHINWTNHSWDMGKRVFDLEKQHPKFFKKIRQNKSFQQNFSKI